MRQTFAVRLARVGGPLLSGVDPLDRLHGRFAELKAAHATAAAEARSQVDEAERRSAEAEAVARQRMESARAAVTRPLAAALKALADGDLRPRIDAPDLAREFDAAIALYGKTIYALASSATAIGAQVREIAENAEGFARGAREESGRLSPARELIREAQEKIARIDRDGRKANELAASLEMALRTAQGALGDGAATLERVAGARGVMGELIETIDGFAFQTHLIALNAGVEAARAGEAGRGIAVVAQELRGLSQQSSEATRALKSALNALTSESMKSAAALRDAASASPLATPLPLAVRRPDESWFGDLEAALLAADARVLRDAEAGEAVGAASRSLEALVGKLAALAGHFRLPGAPGYEMAPAAAPALARPPQLPRARPLRLKAG